jgi:hypothetical protein
MVYGSSHGAIVGHQGIDHGGQFEEAATGPNPSFRQRKPILLNRIPGIIEATRYDCEHEPKGKLLGQLAYRTILQ